MDIIERLRKYQCPENKGCNPVVEYCQCALMDSSADEIERLREALQKIIIQNNFGYWGRNNVEKIARAALKGSGDV